MPDTNIRPATASDLPAIQAMICELAAFEKMSDEVFSTEADLHEALFGQQRCAEAIVVDLGEASVAFALFFSNYSTFVGRPGLYLEDVYVKPDHRGKNIGTQILRHLAGIAAERNYGRMEWSVLDWNQRAIDFYEKHGADVMPQWRIVRTDRAGIEALATEPGLVQRRSGNRPR